MDSQLSKPYTSVAQQAPGRKEFFTRIIKRLARILLWPFFGLDVNGTQNLPHDRAFILLVKHQRWQDIPLLSIAAPRPIYYIAKHELFRNTLSNWFFTALGGIPLNRQRPLESRRFLQSTIALLKAGQGIAIFPEGTYYPDKMGPGQTGMIKFVLSRLDLPFIPVGINYRTGNRRTRVRINFGQGFQAQPTLTADKLVDRLMAEIAKLSGLTIN